MGIPADLTRDEDSRRIVREAANAFGRIDFVWNHVGHTSPASVEGIEMEDFDTAVTLNMRTVLVTTVAAIPEIRARGGGSLLYMRHPRRGCAPRLSVRSIPPRSTAWSGL